MSPRFYDIAEFPPELDDIAALAEAAVRVVPAELRRHLDGVTIHVEEFPSPEIEDDMELDSPFDLLGLYSGVSLAEKSVSATPHDLDRIFLYRRPILDYWCETGESLSAIVRHVLIHEVGHHFGLSDADMDRIEQAADIAADETVGSA
jgi:predicted Zn-dependent protease with MMP-like domain